MIFNRTLRGTEGTMHRSTFVLFSAAVTPTMLCLAMVTPAHAQISFASAIDLALRNSPRVRMAAAEVDRARAALADSHDVYIPSLIASSGLGYSYGYPIDTPTIFSFQAQSLVFNFSQSDYVRAARAGLQATNFSLQDVREQVAEDTAITYLALDRARQRTAAMSDEIVYAQKLQTIVQDRLDAGQDTEMELTRARRTIIQLRLQQLQMEDEVATRTDHLLRLLGMNGMPLATVSGSIPEMPVLSSQASPVPDGPAVLAAEANAKSKLQQAFGDSRYVWRPQVAFAAKFSRFSTFNNYQLYYPAIKNNYNAFGAGVQISLPLFDAGHKARARESVAAAVSSQQDVLVARQQQAEGLLKQQHSRDELLLHVQLATLDNQLARQQLDATLVEINSGTGNSSGPQMTPKDEQNARIQERQRYLDLLDSEFQLRQLEISLLRQTGQLEPWLKSASAAAHASGSGDTGEITPAKP